MVGGRWGRVARRLVEGSSAGGGINLIPLLGAGLARLSGVTGRRSRGGFSPSSCGPKSRRDTAPPLAASWASLVVRSGVRRIGEQDSSNSQTGDRKQLVEGATGHRGFLLGCRLDARRVVFGHPVKQFVEGKTWRRLGCRRVRATWRCGLGRWRGSNWLSQLVLRPGLVGSQSWRNLGRRGCESRCRDVAWVQWVVPTGFGG